MTCIITISQGSLQGKECETPTGKKYYSFEGIPYAKPPIGELRFRDPEPHENWTGIMDATKPGEKCAQMDPKGNGALLGSENCLFLNVYTPVLPCEDIQKLPVIFFVHGGRFLFGYGDYYRPDYLMEKDVILVTINYRLHILGFLCLNIPEARGNAACKDIIMGLKWVKKNIKFFNGDPNNVTVFGESAGAGVITSLLTSKMSNGLFNKMIAQSGVCLSDLYLIDEDPIEKAKTVASILGQEFENIKDLYDFLIKVPISDLVYGAMMAEMNRPPHIINAFFLPVIEKKFDKKERFFEEYPIKVFRENRYKKVPILLGLNSHEGALFLRKDEHGNIQYMKDLQKTIPRYLGLKYNSPESLKLANTLKDFYFGNKDIGEETKNQYIDLVSDAYFNRDILLFAESFAKYSNNLYLYFCKYSGNMHTRVLRNLGIKGASHGDMMPYQFYRQNKAELCDERDRKIVDFFADVFSSFVKTGVPIFPAAGQNWPPYSPGGQPCMIVDDKMEVGPCPVWERANFWIQHMGTRAKL